MKERSSKAVRSVRWCWKSFCLVFFHKKTLKRDLIILSFLIIILGEFLIVGQYYRQKAQESAIAEIIRQNELPLQLSEQGAVQKQEKTIQEVQAEIDISAWTPYQNTWYGFSLKYPSDWRNPVAEKPLAGALWEQKINFRISQSDEANPFEGFDVKIYNVAKVKEVTNTDEFPKLKNEELAAQSECANIEGHLLETGDYPAEEIYLPINDACYNAALFFSNTRGNYIYNIFPKLKEGMGLAGDPTKEIKNHMPEFFAVISTWDLIDIRRPKPVPSKPKITAPHPVSYKVENGRLVCAKKNDKPAKSDKNKGKHLDMECCLDPDEYPNPWCYYDSNKYGKYL